MSPDEKAKYAKNVSLIMRNRIMQLADNVETANLTHPGSDDEIDAPLESLRSNG